MISCRILGGGRVQGHGDRGGLGGDETSLFYWCSSLVKNEPSWLHPEELKFEAKKVLLVYNYWHNNQTKHAGENICTLSLFLSQLESLPLFPFNFCMHGINPTVGFWINNKHFSPWWWKLEKKQPYLLERIHLGVEVWRAQHTPGNVQSKLIQRLRICRPQMQTHHLHRREQIRHAANFLWHSQAHLGLWIQAGGVMIDDICCYLHNCKISRISLMWKDFKQKGRRRSWR